MENKPVPITIMGATYYISCSEEEREALLHSAKLLDQRLKETRESSGLPMEQATMMVALNLASEYLKAKHRHESLERYFNEKLQKLLSTVETIEEA